MTPQPKPLRPFGRLPQCNKALRLQRRRLHQWSPQPPQLPRNQAAFDFTRYELEEREWRQS